MSTTRSLALRVRSLALLVALLILALRSAGAAAAETSAVPQFQSGDSVCFIGDSITHGGIYHRDIVLFYATRFPDRRFEAYNCGISGDSAGGAVARYVWDIQPHKPTVATIMLGMNDVGRGLYEKGKTGPEVEKQRKNAIAGHASNMARLAELLTKDGCKLIVITPSIYDQTGSQKTPSMFGVNDALGTCGQLGRELAARFHGHVVDFHGFMTAINAKGQAKDPSFTIVGPDRVHPGEVGHLLMAYALLAAQGVPALVSETAIDAAGLQVVKQNACKVSGLKRSGAGVEFDSLEGALPFPVPEAAAKALELAPITENLNRQMLQVTGLAAGNYEIVIDGQCVATRSAAELAAGVNLATIKTTPQYKQAVKVRELCDKRHGLISHRLRTLDAVRHFTLERAKPKPADDQAVERLLDVKLEECRKRNFSYGVMQIETYRKFKPQEERLRQEAADAWKAMYVENQPKPHHIAVRPVQK